MKQVALAPPSVLSFREAISDFGFIKVLGPINTYLGSSVHRSVLKNRLQVSTPACRRADAPTHARIFAAAPSRLRRLRVAVPVPVPVLAALPSLPTVAAACRSQARAPCAAAGTCRAVPGPGLFRALRPPLCSQVQKPRRRGPWRVLRRCQRVCQGVLWCQGGAG